MLEPNWIWSIWHVHYKLFQSWWACKSVKKGFTKAHDWTKGFEVCWTIAKLVDRLKTCLAQKAVEPLRMDCACWKFPTNLVGGLSQMEILKGFCRSNDSCPRQDGWNTRVFELPLKDDQPLSSKIWNCHGHELHLKDFLEHSAWIISSKNMLEWELNNDSIE